MTTDSTTRRIAVKLTIADWGAVIASLNRTSKLEGLDVDLRQRLRRASEEIDKRVVKKL